MKWFESGPADANATEILFFAFLLVASSTSAAELDKWATKVIAEQQIAEQHRAAWRAPAEGWGTFNKVSKLFEPMRVAYTATTWGDAELNWIGAAMQLWDGPGQFDGLRSSQLRNHLRKDNVPLGIALKKKDKVPRWRAWSIVRVAELVKRHAVEMRKILKLDIDPERVPTSHERIAIAEKHDEAKLARREERVIALLDRAVTDYAYSKELFAAWEQAGGQAARTDAAVGAYLSGKSEAAQLEYLRKQIEMRTLGLGWSHYATRWSSNKDARIGTVAHLRELLKEILTEEISQRRLKQLPTEVRLPEQSGEGEQSESMHIAACDALAASPFPARRLRCRSRSGATSAGWARWTKTRKRSRRRRSSQRRSSSARRRRRCSGASRPASPTPSRT